MRQVDSNALPTDLVKHVLWSFCQYVLPNLIGRLGLHHGDYICRQLSQAMQQDEGHERREFGFSCANPKLIVWMSIALPSLFLIPMLFVLVTMVKDRQYDVIPFFLPFMAMPVVMGMIQYKNSYTNCVLRVRNEKVIVDPPFLIHIDFNGKDIRRIENVVWVQGDRTSRWTIYAGSISFELRQDIAYFFDIKEYLKQVLPAGVTSSLP